MAVAKAFTQTQHNGSIEDKNERNEYVHCTRSERERENETEREKWQRLSELKKKHTNQMEKIKSPRHMVKHVT